jgi:hypothetical protein
VKALGILTWIAISSLLTALGSIAYEKAECTILNDGKAIKYDLGVV